MTGKRKANKKTSSDLLAYYDEVSQETEPEPTYAWPSSRTVGTEKSKLTYASKEKPKVRELRTTGWFVELNPEFSRATFYFSTRSLNRAQAFFDACSVLGHNKELLFKCSAFQCRLYRPLFAELRNDYLTCYFLNSPLRAEEGYRE